MQRGGNRGAPNDDLDHGGTSGERTWTHPSEMGLKARVHTDRRRSRALVVGLVTLGVAVLAGTAGLATAISNRGGSVDGGASPAPLSGCLALVDMAGPGGSTQMTGLLIGDGDHVVVASDGIAPTSRFTVRIGGQSTPGRVVAHDSYLDLALIELGARIGSPPEMTQDYSVGDSLRVVAFDPAGHRRSAQLRVEGTSDVWSRPDHTIAQDVMTLSGNLTGTGVLVDPTGAVAGLVVGTTHEHAVAYDSAALASLVDGLAHGGDTDHPWIGVRAGDPDPRNSGSGTTVLNATGSATGQGSHHGGAHVLGVLDDSPAQAAGIAAGDIITAVGHHPVTDMADLAKAVSEHSAGDTVTVNGLRNGASVTFSVHIGVFPG